MTMTRRIFTPTTGRKVLRFDTLNMLAGNLSRRARALVLEWAAKHQQELRHNWLLAENHQPLNTIDPLE
jgi:hypothetical protein